LNGKPATGRIHIEAEDNGGETIISVTDDGQGLDREKILSHAVSARLIGQRGDISDDEIFNLVFEPGFSTALHVTEISGRGVGMGVVRENVRKIDGRIDIRSEAGKWTSFIIRIPQTRAIAGWVPAMGRAHPWRQQTAPGLS
ncbi:MAG: chemotaxis protein CheA, partial [Nitrospinae bacterium]|nr:chemotaxis protein CheA [Nitrospinota bacterium]